jgi:hypothetical protein
MDAVSGNCNIVDLALDKVPNIDDGLVWIRALDNNSLLHLAISNILISEANWTTLCESLSRHSTLVHLRLLRTFPHEPVLTSNQRKAHRTEAFLEMLQVNTVLRKLDARGGRIRTQDEFDEHTLSEVIQPFLRVRKHAGRYGGPEYV